MAARIIAYLIWCGFSLWLSFCSIWVWMRIVTWRSFSNELRMGIIITLWAGTVILLFWVPIWVLKKRGSTSRPMMARIATFLLLLSACTIFSTIIWGKYVDGKFYNCTDSIPFDFLHPGDWTHSHDGVPVAVVPKINPSDSMDKPDSIKEGWSIKKLWFLWWAFAAVSVLISSTLPFLIVRSNPPKAKQRPPP